MTKVGTKLTLKSGSTAEIRHGMVDDYPGDASVIYVAALEVPDGQISSIDEVDDPYDQSDLKVGWHIRDCDGVPWEIIGID